MSERLKIEDNSFGYVKIGKQQSNCLSFFGGGTGKQSGVGISFGTSSLIFSDTTSFGGRIHQDRELYDIRMSELQWSNFLFNKNSETGTPCTIVASETGVNPYDLYELESNGEGNFDNEFQEFKKTVEKKLYLIFPELKDLQEELRILIDSKKLSVQDRNRAKEIVSLLKKLFIDRKPQIIDTLEECLVDLNGLTSEIFVKNVKSNLLNFNASQSLEEAKKLLNMVSEQVGETLLLEDNSVEKTMPINKHEAVLILKDVKREGFVEDTDSTNGYSVSLHQAKVSIVSGSKIITAGDLLFQCEFSESQFSEFISNFNQGGVVATNTYTEKLGKIDRSNVNTQVSDRKTEAVFNSLQEIEQKLIEIEDYANENIKSGSISQKKHHELFRELCNFDSKMITNLSFVFGLLVEDKEQEGEYKFKDVVASLRKGIEDLGIQSFVNQMKEGNGNKMLSSFFEKDKNKLLK